MTKDLFIIGDVHGCLYTLKKILENWGPATEQLIFVGDLIDRGNFSPETVAFVRDLQAKYTDTIVLMGNHECEAMTHFKQGNKYWFGAMGEHTLAQYKAGNFDFEDDVKWFEYLPLKWENEYIFISHAGLCETENPYDIYDRRESVIWTRKPLKNIGKLQIHGHTPKIENPSYTKDSNSWNIDSGATYKYYLTAMKIKSDASHWEFIKLDTLKEDYPTITFDKM